MRSREAGITGFGTRDSGLVRTEGAVRPECQVVGSGDSRFTNHESRAL